MMSKIEHGGADERAVVQQTLGSILALLGVVIRELIKELGDRGIHHRQRDPG